MSEILSVWLLTLFRKRTKKDLLMYWWFVIIHSVPDTAMSLNGVQFSGWWDNGVKFSWRMCISSCGEWSGGLLDATGSIRVEWPSKQHLMQARSVCDKCKIRIQLNSPSLTGQLTHTFKKATLLSYCRFKKGTDGLCQTYNQATCSERLYVIIMSALIWMSTRYSGSCRDSL